jgi:L-fucose isomerase-like protein
MNQQVKCKVGVLFLGRRRPGFDVDWGKATEERVRRMLGESGFSIFEPAEKAIDDASLRRVLSSCEAQKVDVMLVLQTTMSDGRLAPTLAQFWPDPVVLWATPEKPDGDMISSCSLVGAHCWASTLRQLGRTFELVYGDPDDAAAKSRLEEAVRMTATIRRLRTTRLGIIGGQAPGYFAMSADPFSVYQGIGTQVQNFSLIEFTNLVNDVKGDAVVADVKRVKGLGIPHKDTSDADLPMASQLYLAMKSLIATENLDALTVREWPEMPNTFGQWPYLGVARLADEGIAVGIEGDADGAMSAWIAENMGLGRCYLSDWLEHDAETITLWHGGAAPFSLCEPIGAPGGPRIAHHFNIKKPAVVEATIRAGMPITVFRFWRLGGRYFLTAREGETIRPRRQLMATNALARMENDPREWFEDLCHAGMPHHVAVVAGHHREFLKRLARAMDMTFL